MVSCCPILSSEIPLPVLPSVQNPDDEKPVVADHVGDEMRFVGMKPDRGIEFGPFPCKVWIRAEQLERAGQALMVPLGLRGPERLNAMDVDIDNVLIGVAGCVIAHAPALPLPGARPRELPPSTCR